MKITYERMYGGGYIVQPAQPSEDYVTVSENENAVPVAEVFGMKLRHKSGCADRGFTDGTVDCPQCGQAATTFVAQALTYLREHEGKMADDPGYFTESAS